MVCGQVPVIIIHCVVLCQQSGNLLTQNGIQFTCRHIFVACHALLNALNDSQRSVHANITCNEHLLQVVQHVVIHLRFTGDGTCQLVKDTSFCLLQTLVQRLFFFLLTKKIKQSHIEYVLRSAKVLRKNDSCKSYNISLPLFKKKA